VHMHDAPHRRYNPLMDSWVLVSPHRATRPWLGQVEDAPVEAAPSYDPDCYLCPGNARAQGPVNPAYEGVYVFDNDFPALTHEGEGEADGNGGLFRSETASGTCRVMCFSPDHSKTLPQLSVEQVHAVIDGWADQAADLGKTHKWVQIFENKGAMMGCSNPHPHGQIWATHHIPDLVATEDRTQQRWHAENGAAMLLNLAHQETGGTRSVVETDHWLAIVPYWAAWPFETLLLPKFAVQRVESLSHEHRRDLSDALRKLTARYDNLFGVQFPYSMGWHAAPYEAGQHPHWQLHAHFYPPLLRSATVRKFMVGYEMLAEPQRDMTPEQAAAQLRAVPDILT
jgi:UDPglucose--hexose-1-phosphate uridylyltransferase